jgi:undecaprenyl-phosphate 4-deoxy-4-formamido-L-arabinose transferase
MIGDAASSSWENDVTLSSGVSVVVPVFNSEGTLPALVDGIVKVLESLEHDFEILLIDDGSADGSSAEIKRLALSDPRIVGVHLSRNYGQHNATLCGVRLARYQTTVTMDDDLQHPPSEIPRLIRKVEEGWDVVYGCPEKGRHGIVRGVLARLTKTVVGRATGLQRVMQQSPFRALRTELRGAFADFVGPDVLIDVLLGWGTTSFGSVTVDYRPRYRGRSNYTLKRLFDMGLLVLTGYSTAPLRVASWIGFGLTVFGVAVLTYAVVLAVFFGSIPGFPFLASLISIFSGAQLFALGVFGEYLTRIFNRALGRPTYVIRETTPEHLCPGKKCE